MSQPALQSTPDHSVGAPESAQLLRVDKLAHEVAVHDRDVGLTAKEFALLVYFVEHRGLALSRHQLIQGVWGPEYTGSNRTVDIHVRRLRLKLGPAFDLVTLRGVGYRLGSALNNSFPPPLGDD